MEWFLAFLVGALVVGVVAFIIFLAIEDPELFSWVVTFFILSFFVGWGVAHLFGWWGAWTSA